MGIRVAALVLSLLSACSILPWPGDPAPPVRSRHKGPLPEPKLADAVEGMILQTYYMLSTSVGDRVALRRCAYVGLSVDRCEITFVVLGRIVDHVPTFTQPSSGSVQWVEQGESASKAVQKTAKRVLEGDRITLARTGVYGVAELPEGPVSARLVDERVELVAGSPPRVLATAQVPGMRAVVDSYVSRRAPNVRAVHLTSRTHESRSESESFVVFRRVAANDWRVSAVIPPLDGWPTPATDVAVPATGSGPPLGVATE